MHRSKNCDRNFTFYMDETTSNILHNWLEKGERRGVSARIRAAILMYHDRLNNMEED